MLIDPYRQTAAAALAWNPLDKDSDVVLSFGNTVATVTAALGSVRAFQSRDMAEDRYFEVTISGADERQLVGIANSTAGLADFPGSDNNAVAYYAYNGTVYRNGSGIAFTGVTAAPGDVIGVRVYGGSNVDFYKNGSFFGGATFSGVVFPIWGPGWDQPGDRIGTINLSPAVTPSGSSAWV